MKTKYSRYHQHLEQLEQQHQLRVLPDIPENIRLNLSTNDYLGLQYKPELLQEFHQTYSTSIPFSAASSRLLTGNHNFYKIFENVVAQIYQREACLMFNSGYHANTGILPAISNKNDLILADKLVHASIIDGLQLCNAKAIRYPHLNYQWIEAYLQKHRDDFENVILVTESLFSMDGDICNLKKMIGLKHKFNCILYVDEAHAIGVRGLNGLGIAEEQQCIKDIDFIIGTLGKALYSVGAFVICNEVMKKYVINTCRTLIFTSALPPLNVAWSTFIFQKMLAMQDERKKLGELINLFNSKTNTNNASQIAAIIIGENLPTIRISENLKKHGFWALPIRHPTVPKGTSRLRISLHAAITYDDLKDFCDILNNEIKPKLFIRSLRTIGLVGFNPL